MEIDYLSNLDGRVHAINCSIEENELCIGILCLIAFPDSSCRITNENHSLLVEIPKPFRSGSERVKVFNCKLNISDHEQV